MKRLLVVVAAAGLALTLAGNASAQYRFQPIGPPPYGPGYRQPLNPYLQLTRPGDPATNYFLGTIPEFQRRQSAQEQRDFELDTRARERLLGEELPQVRPIPSGTYSLVNNTGGYFNNTFNYFGTGPRPATPIPRRPPQRPGTPAHTGGSSGFQPNPGGSTPR